MMRFIGVLLSAVCLATLAAAAPAAAQTAKIAVIADPHFYDSDLGTTGEAFEAYLAQDRKMLRESEAILKSAVGMIRVKRPDLVLVPGDLTKDGERTSHEKFAAYLARLEATGSKVLVCPGNHDINNPHAVSFDGATMTPVPSVTPEEFATIYQDFGFGEALERDPASLSYLAEPVAGLWVLSLDVCKYGENLTTGHPETGGALRPETLAWVLEKLAEARALGKQVIAIQHHGITEHYIGQSTAFSDYVVDDWETVSATLANAGLQMVFTGHYHANDITRTVSEAGLPTLYDIETGSLVTYPSPIRFLTLTENQAAIHTEFVTHIPYPTGGVPFPEYAQDFLYDGLLGIAQYTLVHQYGLDAGTAADLAPYVADAFAAHYAGDESPDAATMAFIQGLMDPANDDTTRYLGGTLSLLWTDLPPADTSAFLDLSLPIELSVAGTYHTDIFDEGAAEIVAFDPASQRLFVVNGFDNAIDVLDAADPEDPTLAFQIDLAAYGDGVNSVAVKDGLVAVAVQADPKQDPGRVVFFDTDGGYLNQVTVGALPDMLTFTPDGSRVLVANEGEPDDDYLIDPEGSVSIIDLSGGALAATVASADFTAFDGQESALKAAGVRIFGPGATVARDLEPEYIALSADSRTAWIACQENNAVAVLDIDAGTITAIFPLGFKDHSLMENALDASNRDDGVNLTPYPNLFGMYQPDAMATFQVDGETYLVTANEGDSRDYDGFSEEARVKDLILDPAAFPAAADLQENEILGRLHVTTTLGQGPNGFEALYAYGARSFSIFKPTADAMELVFDSGSQFETLTAAMLPTAFNANNDDNDSFDSRSDDKGPEPEAVAVGVVDAKPYAFVGLERVGGIMVYDLSDPAAPLFVQYLNNRDFDAPVDSRNTGDLGVEGLAFISAAHSPTGKAMLAAANEVSGTTTLFTISADAPALPGDLDGNEIVDRDDTAIIRFHLRQPAAAFPAADIDGDGTITVLDARKLVRLCTCPRCLCR